MTKRTNEPETGGVELRGSAARRLAGLFLAHGILGLSDIYRILKTSYKEPEFSPSAVRGVLYRWQKRRVLLTDGRRYILNPRGGREILLKGLGADVRTEEALDQPTRDRQPVRTERIVVDVTPRWWAEVFDLPAAWMENTRIHTRIDEHVAKMMWALCEMKPRPRDRSQKARHREPSFTLVVFPHGKLQVYTKDNPKWLDHLGTWLRTGGLGPSDLRIVASAIQRKLATAIGTLEIPLKVPTDPTQQFQMTVETERRKATIRLVHSHFDLGEIEARGDLQFRLDWLGMLAGATIETMAHSDELAELKTERTELETELSQLREKLDNLSSKLNRLEDEREQREQARKRKPPQYVG